MATIFPPDLQGFIQQELASGDFQNESELLVRALEVYRELKTRDAQLRNEVQASIAAAERGEVTPLDMSQIIGILARELDPKNQSKR
jgi:Arc/MetJ-type ribon-helix-helix transcriptional regulator